MASAMHRNAFARDAALYLAEYLPSYMRVDNVYLAPVYQYANNRSPRFRGNRVNCVCLSKVPVGDGFATRYIGGPVAADAQGVGPERYARYARSLFDACLDQAGIRLVPDMWNVLFGVVYHPGSNSAILVMGINGISESKVGDDVRDRDIGVQHTPYDPALARTYRNELQGIDESGRPVDRVVAATVGQVRAYHNSAYEAYRAAHRWAGASRKPAFGVYYRDVREAELSRREAQAELSRE